MIDEKYKLNCKFYSWSLVLLPGIKSYSQPIDKLSTCFRPCVNKCLFWKGWVVSTRYNGKKNNFQAIQYMFIEQKPKHLQVKFPVLTELMAQTELIRKYSYNDCFFSSLLISIKKNFRNCSGVTFLVRNFIFISLWETMCSFRGKIQRYLNERYIKTIK